MAGKRIYIAEDDPIQQKIEASVLKAYDTMFFPDGLELYRKVLEDPPDMLVLDIILPTMTGLAISRLLKFEDDYRNIPILIVSSITDPDLEEQVRAVGADAFLPKPLKMDKFSGKVGELLSQAQPGESEVVSH